MRPGGPRPLYRGALAIWLTLVTVPATAQVTLLTGQNLLSQSAIRYPGNHLVVDGGLIYTDNVQRTENGSSQTLLLLGLSGDIAGEGTRLDYRLASNLALLKYLGGAYGTQPTGYLDGTLFFKVVPSFFTWIARETYTQLQINPYAAVTPDNLENVNYITTGPRFTMRPTLRTSVTLDALYSYLTTSSSASQRVDLDNHRYGGDLKIDRAFSETASLYIKGEYEKVDFKDQVDNNNFAHASASAGYRLGDTRTVLDISGGYSQVRVYDVLTIAEGPGGNRESRQTEKFDTPIWALDLSRLITPHQRVALTASQQFTDAAAAFRLNFDQAVPTVPPSRLANGEAFKQRQFGLHWQFQVSRTSLRVGATEFQERYVTTTVNDRNVKLADVLLTRQLSPALSGELLVSYQNQEQVGAASSTGGTYTVADQSAKTLSAVADLRWQVGERLALRFLYAHSRQNDVYSDNQIGVTASWALIGAQMGLGRPFPALTPVSPLSTQSPASTQSPYQ
jgi:hypothetical protein